MNAFILPQAIITFLLAFVPWLIPDCQWYIKTIIVLVILLFSIASSWLRLYFKLRDSNKNLESLNKEKQEIAAKHNALSVQFNEKIEKEKRYRKFIASLTLAFMIALEKEDRPKIEHIYRVFLLEQERLKDGGASDGKSNQNSKDYQ